MREDGEIVAARGMHIGPDGMAWLGMDGPVPGVTTDDYEPDAALCAFIVADGLVRGARSFIADIEAPSAEQATPAYENFGAARLHAAVRPHALDAALMHASIWKFAGDPDELLRRYDAMVAEIPRARMRLAPLPPRAGRDRARRHLPDSAPGRNRTCDLALRRRALYPLSYRRSGGQV